MSSKIEKLVNKHVRVNVILATPPEYHGQNGVIAKRIKISAKFIDLFQLIQMIGEIGKYYYRIPESTRVIVCVCFKNYVTISSAFDNAHCIFRDKFAEITGCTKLELQKFCLPYCNRDYAGFSCHWKNHNHPNSIEILLGQKTHRILDIRPIGKKIPELYAEIMKRLDASEYLSNTYDGNTILPDLEAMMKHMLSAKIIIVKRKKFIPSYSKTYHDVFMPDRKTKNNIRILTIIQLPIELHAIVIKKFNIF